ncbi:MAG TPA: hypothetical protein VGY53_11755, partial [Isosphaeraceae bacterium]|nr:hypothetical protein [Isosphaeraceae bacterium]
MSAAILVCSCGRRLKAASIPPGKSGRCPSCGTVLRAPASATSVPGASKDPTENKRPARPSARPPRQVKAPKPPEPASGAPAPAEDDEWNWTGIYELAPETAPAKRQARSKRATELPDRWPGEDEEAEPSAEPESSAQASPVTTSADNDEWNWKGTYDLLPVEPPRSSVPLETQTAFEGGDLPPRATAERPRKSIPRPEAWWPPKLTYPLRAAEGVCMVAALGGIFWVMGTLIPEYCLTLVADGEKLGAELMGRLVVMLSALPFVIMVPLVVFYWLLYLGRVLVASAEGDNRPPRPPDRNFEGFLTGILP